MNDLATRIRALIDDHVAPLTFDEVVRGAGASIERKGPRRRALVVAAALLAVLAVSAVVAFVALGVEDTGPSITAGPDTDLGQEGTTPADPSLPDLGTGQVWPGPDASPEGRMTPTDAAVTFTLDVFGQRPTATFVDPDASSEYAWVNVALGDAGTFRVLFVPSRKPQDHTWVAIEVNEGGLSVNGRNELVIPDDILNAASIRYFWRDDVGVHRSHIPWPPPPDGNLPMQTIGQVHSAVVIVRDSSGAIVFVSGGHFFVPSESPPTEQPAEPSPIRWTLKTNDDGTITVTGFNEYIAAARPEWASSLGRAAVEFVRGLGGERGSIEASHAVASELDPERPLVTVVEGGLRDDSVAAMRFDLVFTWEDSFLRLVSGTWQMRCQPGRGHQDFQAALCL